MPAPAHVETSACRDPCVKCSTHSIPNTQEKAKKSVTLETGLSSYVATGQNGKHSYLAHFFYIRAVCRIDRCPRVYNGRCGLFMSSLILSMFTAVRTDFGRPLPADINQTSAFAT
jgi:hypothetical protein